MHDRPHPSPGVRLRPRAVPAALVLAGVACFSLAVLIDLRTTPEQRETVYAGPGWVTALIGVCILVPAAVVLSARPRHRVGLVLAAFGAVWVLDGVAESWSAYAFAHDLPGADLAFWFVARFGSVLLLGPTLLLVLYPTGRLMTGRWRTVSIVAVVAACVQPILLLIASDPVLFEGRTNPGLRSDFLALPLPDRLVEIGLGLGLVVSLGTWVAALAVVWSRHRRADEHERRQLRWLLWAGIVMVLTVAVLALVGQGTLSTIVLAVALVVTATSIAVGIVNPDLADIDSLVAGTLTFAGVAGVLVVVDLTLLAAANQLLDNRPDERDVTLVVLVLAVLVYGPLRSLLAGGVRRLLFGRRGDRYGVVSSFAARLEQIDDVESQLPALTAAVASTFKVAFVRVEVVAPDGGTLSSTHGEPRGEQQELDIAYGGERIGRLVLPVRGLRSQLTRRDQELLVDLVRQAAIALRSGLLARQVQESRERLVLAREDDRRRIRRDLHDGLGPVLSGVAMRLDAARLATAADPDKARDLIATSRTDISGALADVRRLVHDLRPPALDDLGLLVALEQQADRLQGGTDFEILAEGTDNLPAAVEVAAYRIVSEALTNVARHAGAARCSVRLVGGDRALEIWVRDDGRGIPSDVVSGVGLRSLRERAEELGGQCEVTCPGDGGTMVWAWLPYGREERA